MISLNSVFKIILISIMLILILAVLLSSNNSLSSKTLSKISLNNLCVEYKTNPIGIDVMNPRLSWEIISDERGVKQTAYQIRVATEVENLKAAKNLPWDTGRVQSDQSIHVEYQGQALKSSQRVYWQVRTWDKEDRPSDWSEVAFWEMGLLDPSDWKVAWISPDIEEDITKSQPCPFLRKEFQLSKEVKSARAYVTSRGLYEIHLNGKRIDDQLFTPGWTSYNKRLQYQIYDITQQLKKGNNAVGAILGDGWYRGYLGWNKKRNYYGKKLALLLQIQLAYQDGTSEIIGTDNSWNAITGPILESDIYNGEIYDARLEMKGWSRAGFDDSGWKPVMIVDHSKEILVASAGPPVRKIQEIKPQKIFKTLAGETVVDMGQNFVGWIQLKVKGTAGTAVTLRHAEVLNKDGNFYTENLRSAKQRVRYILKGSGEEIYEPHFTFQGFRYVAVDGYPGELDLNSLTGIVIHSDMRPTGNFSCSNELINQLQHNIQWGQKGNFLDVPTDCPQRDERMGWTGDAQVFAPTACFNMDAASFYTKWLLDLTADQFDDGVVPHVVPDVQKAGGSAAWADAAVIVPWTVYLYYGDKRILQRQYQSMKAWVDYMKKQAGENYLWQTGHHFGDWLAYATTRSDYPGATTDKDLIATAYFAHSTDIFRRVAKILNKEDDATAYTELFEKIKKAFQNEFITSNGRMASNTQTAYSLALAFDLVSGTLRQKVAERLADDVKKFKHLTTGFVGTPLLNSVLSETGYLDLAYMLLNSKQYPSWLYPITRGATTIWERWDGIKPDGSFQNPGMNSFNHYAYGAIGDWMYRVVAGIEIDSEKPGYKHIIIRPQPGGELTSASATHQSMYGKIESSWKVEKGKFHLSVTIPPNTTATVVLPDALVAEVLESGKSLGDVKRIVNYVQQENAVKIDVGSGKYHFICKQRN